MFEFLRRIKRLETSVERLGSRLDEIDRQKECARGKHEWEMGHYGDKPYIRCKHCCEKLPEKTS